MRDPAVYVDSCENAGRELNAGRTRDIQLPAANAAEVNRLHDGKRTVIEVVPGAHELDVDKLLRQSAQGEHRFEADPASHGGA